MSSDSEQDAEVGESGLAQDKNQPASSAFDQFDASILPPVLLSTLKKKGFESLTAVQEAVVRADTNARDVRISSQTGSGKTVAVGVAIGRQLLQAGSRDEQIKNGAKIHPKAPQVLLLTPTRELATQVKRELAWLFAEVPDAFVEVVTGGTSVEHRKSSHLRPSQSSQKRSYRRLFENRPVVLGA